MNSIARWSADDRRDLFNQTAARRSLAPTIIEKDFWVCWTLMHLFGTKGLGEHIVFKGGTSLSKAYGAIARFSEDIDLSISLDYLGIGPETPPSRSQREKRQDRIGKTCDRAVGESILPSLVASFEDVLGKRTPDTWSLRTVPDDTNTLAFAYPVATATPPGYVAPIIRLEFGSGVDAWPRCQGMITPYAAEEFPALFDDTKVYTTVLDIVRTFWEKVTILHMLNTRTTSSTASRMSRHFYDVAAMLSHPSLAAPVDSLGVLRRAADYKANYFPTAGVSYADCYSGSLRLVPPSTRLSSLDDDYRSMRPMFFGAVPPFAEIIQALSELEILVNAACA